MIYLRLFYEFFKTGLFAVGGGMATIPFLLDISTRTGWFSTEELANMIAISESTPGPIGVNMATYVGFHTGGVPGALCSTIGLVTPSLIIIILISLILSKFRNNPIVNGVFNILRASVIGLMVYALWTVASLTLFKGNTVSVIPMTGFVVFTALIYFFKKIHPLFFILLGAVFGIILL